jgi:PAS domain S-box-containing protein
MFEASQFFWLIDELEYGVTLIDKDQKILWLNNALEVLFSVRRDAVRGMDSMKFIHDYIVPQIEEKNTFNERVVSSLAAGISIRNIEFHRKQSPGSLVWIEYSSQIVEEGPFKGMRMDVYQNITLRKQLEQELSRHFGHLGEMIEERTNELKTVNEQLQQEINDRKRVEEELRKERDFSSSIVRGSPAFFVAISPDGTVMMMNESMLSAIGYSRSEVIGKNYIQNFVPESDRILMSKFFQGVTASCESFINENKLLTRDQKELLVEWHGRPVYLDTGELDYFFGVGIDITERKRVEMALSQSENLYRTIFETTGSATIIINEDTTIALANTEFEKLFGYLKEETEGRSWIDLIVKDDVEKMWEYHRLRRIDSHLAPRNYELRLKDKKGAVRHVSMTIAMIPDTGKSVASLLDITERKRADEEITQHNRHLSTINQIIAAATSAGTLDELLHVALEKTLALLEFEAGSVYLVDPKRERAEIRSHRGLPDWYLKGSETLTINEEPNRQVFIDGQPRYVEKKDIGILSLANIPFLANGTVIGAVYLVTSKQYHFSENDKEVLGSICKQIGSAIQKRILQEQLEKSYRESTLYLDIISHDINNANNVSIMYGELLMEMLEGEKKEFAEKLVSSIRRSVEIIGNVSKIRKLYEETSVLKPIDLDSLIRSEIRNFDDAHIHYEGTHASVMADYLLSEVFTNLIGNSIKFGGPNVDITIRVENHGDEVEVAVEDTGPGIAAKVKPLIFNRFQRGESKASGKGLGLYLSRMLVERYGGCIWVEDRIPNHPEMGVSIKFKVKKAAV